MNGLVRRWRDERGMGGIEVLPFGVLTFVVGSLIVANAWGVVDAKGAAVAAAREGARSFVEATDATTAHERAERTARDVLRGMGRDPSRSEVLVEGVFARCAPVLVRVRHPVPAIRLPWVGGFGGVLHVEGRHSEVVDPYRSGEVGAGAASCG